MSHNSRPIELKRPIPRRDNHVAVGLLCGDQIQTDTAMCLGAMMLGMRTGGLFHVRNSLVPSGRNMMIEAARGMGAGWLLMIDSDMVFPQDALTHLLSRGKDIVGATYPKRVPPHDLNYKLLPTDTRLEVPGGLVEVAGLPAGMLLINMKVFDALDKPYFQTPAFRQASDGRIVEAVTGADVPPWLKDYANPMHLPGLVGEDYFFCAAARAAGFQVWLDVDLSQHIGHIGQQTWFPQTYDSQEAHGPASVGIPKAIHQH